MTTRMRAADVMDRPASAAVRRTLDAEADEIRREVRSRFGAFVLDRVSPGSRFRDRACQPLDIRLFEEASDIGLLQFALPPEIGGAGRDKFEWGVAIAEIARISGDPGFPVLLDITVENAEMILSSGRPELIDRYVPDLVAGRRFAVQAAYESRDPYDYRTTARYEDGEWVLNGVKRFCAGAVFANVFLIYVRDQASNDMLAFVVERNDPGVAPVRLETMGLRSMGLGQVVLHDVRLPEWRLVWRSDALSELNTYARNRRMISACGVVGAMDAVIESCVQSLANRRRGGRRVLDYPNLERSVGEMRVLLETARSIVYRALEGTRAPGRDPYFDELATSAKHQVSECALRVGQLVMNLQGGEGYMSAFRWDQFMRDILGLIGGQGSQELLLIHLGQRSIVGSEGRQLRENSAERSVAKLADAWWLLAALEARQRVEESNRPALAAAVLDVLTTARLAHPLDATTHDDLVALLDRADALLSAVGSSRAPDALPIGPSGVFDGRLGELATSAWRFLACTIAAQTGLLSQFVQPRTAKDAAERAGISDNLATELLDVLVNAKIVRALDDGRYVVNEGLEPVLAGGPRTAAFAARLRRAAAGGTALRDQDPYLGQHDGSGRDLAGRGNDAPVLAGLLASTLLGHLEGLEELLDEPGLRLGCAATDAGRSAAALSKHIPITPVLAIEPDQMAAERALARQDPNGAPIEVRVGDVTSFDPSDRLALAWLPATGIPVVGLTRAIRAAGQALVPGGWLIVPCSLAPQNAVGAAVTRLELVLADGEPLADGQIEELLRQTGLGHVRTLWEDTALGVRLIAARQPG
jgi:alkylation response protein AidB-like acyl-CoA dehydrogenase